MSLARVTVLGKDHAHLEVRTEVLRHFWAVRAISLGTGEQPDTEADVVVVCSSLPEHERQEWVDRVREASPAILIVKMNGFDAGPHLAADATVDEANGPGALVSTIYALLAERGLASRRWAVPETATRLQ